jgi:hypothetical protein
MTEKHARLLMAIQLICFLLLLPACNAPTGSGEKQIATPPPSELPPTQTLQVVPVKLDPCSLLTEREVSPVLGGLVQAQPAQGTGGCSYLLNSAVPSGTAQLVLSAAQGEEAKSLTLLSIGFLASFSGDVNMGTKLEAIQSQIAELSLSDLLSQLADLFQGTDITATLSVGPGESRLWLLYEGASYSQGTLIMMRGEEYVSLTQIGGNLSAAPDQLARLGEMAFERLPPAFYTLNENGDGSFTFDSGAGSEARPASVETGAPAESAGGLVWVTAPNAGLVYAIDAAMNTVVKTIEVGPFPNDIAVAGGGVWVESDTAGTIWRIDPQSFEVVQTVQFNGSTANIDAGPDALWVSGDLGVRMIDLGTGTRYDVVYNPCYDVAIGDEAIWVSQTQDRQLLEIDPESRRVAATVKLDGQPTWIAYGQGYVWTVLKDKHELVAIDPATRQVEHRQSFEFVVNGLAAGPDRIWYSNPLKLGSIEPKTWTTGGVSPATIPNRIAYFAGSLWTTGGKLAIVTRYDPDSGQPVAEIRIGTDPTGIVGGE